MSGLAEINGCVDEYTNLPVEPMQLEFAKGQEIQEDVTTFATVIMGLVSVPILLVLAIAFKEFCPRNTDADDEYSKVDDA